VADTPLIIHLDCNTLVKITLKFAGTFFLYLPKNKIYILLRKKHMSKFLSALIAIAFSAVSINVFAAAHSAAAPAKAEATVTAPKADAAKEVAKDEKAAAKDAKKDDKAAAKEVKKGEKAVAKDVKKDDKAAAPASK